MGETTEAIHVAGSAVDFEPVSGRLRLFRGRSSCSRHCEFKQLSVRNFPGPHLARKPSKECT